MPAPRKVSSRQMELLLEFAESHRNITLGRTPKGPHDVRASRKKWESVTIQLNSVAEGTTKTLNQWRRYWIEFKAKTKAKAADSRRNASATGGGRNKLIPLTDIEKRVLSITNSAAVERLPGVSLPTNILLLDDEASTDPGTNPSTSYLKPSTSTPLTLSLNSNSHSEPVIKEEWLEDEIAYPFGQRPHDDNSEAIPKESEEQSTEFVQQPRALRPSRSSTHTKSIRDKIVPRWAYEIEKRRIATEERHASALEMLVTLIRDIRNDVHQYVHRFDRW